MITCHRNLKEKRWFLTKGQGRENQETLKREISLHMALIDEKDLDIKDT